MSCTSIPETLLESELFGHEKGAFTDARDSKKGLAEIAAGGTLFLDEIGDLPLSIQAKLLTLLEDREFRRVGGNRLQKLDARVVAATNRNLERAVAEGSFREDLYYRLKVVPIHIPTLAERSHDILPLADLFLNKFAHEFGQDPQSLTSAASAMLQAYAWPGNVRELRNTIERAVLLSVGKQVDVTDLSIDSSTSAASNPGLPSLPIDGIDLEKLEQAWVVEALDRCDGNRSKAALLLGMKRDQIRYRIDKYKLDS